MAQRQLRRGRATRRPEHPEAYVDLLVEALRPRLLAHVESRGAMGEVLPDPADLAALLGVGLPDAGPVEMDPHFDGLGPFYDSAGARHQLGRVTKQAIDSRRTHHTVLAMRAGDGTWLYPAWQFTGAGDIHAALRPVLKALRGLDRWAAGTWLVSDHPALGGRSPRAALREGSDPDEVAALARADAAALVA